MESLQQEAKFFTSYELKLGAAFEMHLFTTPWPIGMRGGGQIFSWC